MTKEKNIVEVHIPSVLGYEKVAMDSASAVAKIMSFHKNRIDDLKTAVAEACTNAIEHGNRLKRNTMVLVTLSMSKESLEVKVRDAGDGFTAKLDKPAIENQVEGTQDTRGWGVFLIKNLVDELQFEPQPEGGNVTRMVIYLNRE